MKQTIKKDGKIMTVIERWELFGKSNVKCRCNLCKGWFLEDQILLDENRKEICPACFESGYIERRLK